VLLRERYVSAPAATRGECSLRRATVTRTRASDDASAPLASVTLTTPAFVTRPRGANPLDLLKRLCDEAGRGVAREVIPAAAELQPG
jgi:hypothetical protein